MLKDFIENNLLNSAGKYNQKKCRDEWFIKSGHSSLLHEIKKYPGTKLIIQINSARHSILETPTCKYCENEVKEKKTFFSEFCSFKCSMKNPDRMKKAVSNTDYSARNKKTEETCLARYGVKSANMIKEVKDRQKKAVIQKYGVQNISQLQSIKDRKEKTKNTNYPIGSEKRKLAFASKKRVPAEIVQSILEDVNEFSPLELSSKYKLAFSTVYRILHENGHSDSILSIGKSYYEKLIHGFLEENGIEFISNDRKIIGPQEIDVVIPSSNLGLEFNGIFWHSECSGKDKNYHLNKTCKAEEKGFNILHIFETEWIEKQEIVKSLILSRLGKRLTKYQARKMEIKKVEKAEEKEFLNANHIQGFCGSTAAYGLYDSNELISIMTFGKSRMNKSYEWEMIRYCNKINMSTIGGAARLLKHFEKENVPKSLITYSDRRLFTGKVYLDNGFEFSHYSQPNYFYWHKNEPLKLYSRQKYQKHKLSSLLETYDPERSEYDNMLINGFNRIWDCGNSVFTKSYIQ